VKQLEQLCHEIAVAIDGALRPLCAGLRWEVETDEGTLMFLEAPIPPAT
jgi:hypothetical protein